MCPPTHQMVKQKLKSETSPKEKNLISHQRDNDNNQWTTPSP